MASLFMGSCEVFLFLVLFYSFLFHFVTCTEFVVGGDNGWTIPKGDERMYNEWASKNRFKVDDTVRFKYKKDSLLVVTAEEYKKCRSSHPSFFSNNGDTSFKLDRPDLFYFISGVTGHCERGQKMIIKVLEPESPAQSANDTSIGGEHKRKNAAEPQASAVNTSTIFMVLGMSLIALLFV